MTDKIIHIRPFDIKDTEDIHRICKITCSDKFLLENEDVLYAKYADYYMNEEPDNIFILADENDDAKGYILCSSRPERFISKWRDVYMEKINGHGFICTALQHHTLLEVRFMARHGYNAHMHIDIDPEFQHCGGGTKLVDALRHKLCLDAVHGLYLVCANSNRSGMNFYRHYGFTPAQNYAGITVFKICTK